jgi:hypothetical protein
MPSDHSSDQSPVHDAGHDAGEGEGAAHKAGAFDIRTFIGALIGIYGVVLVVTGLVSSDGRTINLLAGVSMVAGAAVFLIWARLRPIVVPETTEMDGAGMDHAGPPQQ